MPVRAIRFREAGPSPPSPLWTIEEALEVVRHVQFDVRQFHYHLCLGGSVLNFGSSNKDLDLFFLPMNDGHIQNKSGLVDWLEKLWGASEILYSEMSQGGYVNHEGVIWAAKFSVYGRRLDVFIIR